jgi:putative nucleotidyltransferase with HDIG domain
MGRFLARGHIGMSIPDKLLAGIKRLDPLPVTVQRLITALNQEELGTSEIIQIVEYDPAIAANILRAANSAAYAGRFQIDRLRDAVVRLGTTTLLNLVLGEHFRSMKTSAPLFDLLEDDLWLHGAAASLAVKAIIRETRPSKVPEAAGIAALVHDIGKLIMVRYLDADVAKILELCEEEKLSFVEAEKELFGCDHAEVGGSMARNWGFPEVITAAIERHHQYPPSNPNPMLDAVMLANLTAKTIGVGLGAAAMNIRIDDTGCRERIGLTLEGFERVCAQTAIWLQDFRKE